MKKLGLLSIAIAVLASPSIAQNFYNVDWNIMGAGARAHGMGGAFIGVADDATAISWNPAGIAQLDKMEASIVGVFNVHKTSLEITAGGTSETNDETMTHFAPSFASFIFPLKVSERNLTMAVAYQRLIDFGFGLKQEDEYDFTTRTVKYVSKIKTTGGLDAITPALAIQLTPQFSLGLAGNIIINGTKYTEDESYPDYSNSYWKRERTNDFSGFNINGGVLFNTTKFNLGAMIRLPFTLKEDVKGSTDWNLTQASMSYNGQMTGSTSSTAKYETQMPLMMGFGLAVKPTDKLTLAADLEMRMYKDKEVTAIANGTTSTQSMGWNNCTQIRAGLEYVISGQNAVFPIRLGFRTDPKVYNKYTGTFASPDTGQAVGLVFTSGFGLVMGRVMFDVAGEYGLMTPIDAEGSISGQHAAVVQKETNLNIMASCIFHF